MAPRTPWLVWVCLWSCTVQTIDLRGETRACAAGERHNPETGQCAPCEPLAPNAELACPCGHAWFDAPFPACDQALVCLPCTGDITSCRAFNSASGTTWSCDLLLQCCAALAADPSSLACCPGGAQVVCAPGETDGQYRFSCAAPADCCAGSACPNGDGDCESWQTCDTDSGSCTPACEPGVDYCCADCGCACRPIPDPPI